MSQTLEWQEPTLYQQGVELLAQGATRDEVRAELAARGAEPEAIEVLMGALRWEPEQSVTAGAVAPEASLAAAPATSTGSTGRTTVAILAFLFGTGAPTAWAAVLAWLVSSSDYHERFSFSAPLAFVWQLVGLVMLPLAAVAAAIVARGGRRWSLPRPVRVISGLSAALCALTLIDMLTGWTMAGLLADWFL